MEDIANSFALISFKSKMYLTDVKWIVLQDKSLMDPFLIPLVIVGGKYDMFQVSCG